MLSSTNLDVLGIQMNFSLQAARRLVKDIETTFECGVPSDVLADTTKDPPPPEVLHRTRDVLNNLMESHERTALRARQLDRVHSSYLPAVQSPWLTVIVSSWKIGRAAE